MRASSDIVVPPADDPDLVPPLAGVRILILTDGSPTPVGVVAFLRLGSSSFPRRDGEEREVAMSMDRRRAQELAAALIRALETTPHQVVGHA